MENRVEFETPRISQRGKSDPNSFVNIVLRKAMENPGKWVLIYESTRYTRPAPRPMRGSLWERAYRTEKRGEKEIHKSYVRYIGQ